LFKRFASIEYNGSIRIRTKIENEWHPTDKDPVSKDPEKSPQKEMSSALIFISLDAIFLYFQHPIFTRVLRKIQGPTKLKYIGVVLCYICLILALNWFILIPRRSILDAFILGVCIYGVYEGTTYAVLDGWPLHVVMVDTIWGGIVFALTTWIYRLKINLL